MTILVSRHDLVGVFWIYDLDQSLVTFYDIRNTFYWKLLYDTLIESIG